MTAADRIDGAYPTLTIASFIPPAPSAYVVPAWQCAHCRQYMRRTPDGVDLGAATVEMVCHNLDCVAHADVVTLPMFVYRGGRSS